MEEPAVSHKLSTTNWTLRSLATGLILVASFSLIGCRTAPPSQAPTEEEEAYFQQIVVTDARLSVTDNFLGQKVFFLDAQVTNKGTKAVRRLVLQLEFIDTLNQVVLRDKAFPITLQKPPLKPGETRAFRAAFENMPADWNQGPPAMKVINLQF
jgi:hypothetical protein